MNAPAPRIVVLTSGYVNGRNLTRALHALGIPFDIVTICFDPPKRGNRGPLSHALKRLDSYIRSFGVLREIKQRSLPQFPFRPRYTGFCNGKRTLETLQRLQPDYIVMMGGGILSDRLIRTARIGVLNSHPGLLPWIRGVHVVETALLREVAIGITCHFIDTGIDTGDIISRHLLPVHPDDTLASLLHRANQLECAAMLDIVRKAASGSELPRTPQTERFPLCRFLDPDQLAQAEEAVKNGTASRLAEQWRSKLLVPEATRAEECLKAYFDVMALKPARPAR